jgi:isopentenyldiphosphate isomerase
VREEEIALYDPDDPVGRVTGSAPRSLVRARNLPHAGTGVVLRRGDGRVLVHRRSAAKDLWPSRYDAASGGLVRMGSHRWRRRAASWPRRSGCGSDRTTSPRS